MIARSLWPSINCSTEPLIVSHYVVSIKDYAIGIYYDYYYACLVYMSHVVNCNTLTLNNMNTLRSILRNQTMYSNVRYILTIFSYVFSHLQTIWKLFFHSMISYNYIISQTYINFRILNRHELLMIYCLCNDCIYNCIAYLLSMSIYAKTPHISKWLKCYENIFAVCKLQKYYIMFIHRWILTYPESWLI